MMYINVRLTKGNRKGCLASRPGAAPGITHARSGLPQASCEALGAGTLARGCGGGGCGGCGGGGCGGCGGGDGGIGGGGNGVWDQTPGR